MKSVWCAFLLRLALAAEIHVRERHDLRLVSTFSSANGTYFWAKSRSWKEGQDQIAKNNNCSVKTFYQNRITECGQVLEIKNVTKLDEGQYNVRMIYNRSSVEFENFKVNVYDMQPVLSPTLIHRTKIHFWCGDLKNRFVEPYIEIRPVKNEYNADLKKLSKHYWYVIIGNLVNGKYPMSKQYLFRTELRCCSKYYDDSKCGPWTFVGHHMYLSSRKNRGRPWCSYRGEHRLAGVSFDYNHDGPLFEPVCLLATIKPSNSNQTVCAQNKLTITDISKYLKKQRLLGGVKKLTNSDLYSFKPEISDTGLYFDYVSKFYLTVKPRLYVAIQAVKIHDNFIELSCAHTGSDTATILWYIEGKYSSYKLVNNNIIIYQDCWLDWDYWYYEFGVNCRVFDWPMEGYSRWLMGKVKRTNLLDYSIYG